MRDIKTYITEGFFDNVGAGSPEKIVRMYLDSIAGFKSIWRPRVLVNNDTRKHRYNLVIPHSGAILRLHNGVHKTDRKDIKIDCLKEWANCFQYLFDPNASYEDSWHNEINFDVMPAGKDKWKSDELWIYKRDGNKPLGKQIEMFYVYRLDKEGNIYFKKTLK